MTSTRPSQPGARGFSLLELLIVIVVIAILIALLSVGLSQALRAGGVAATNAQLRALAQGTEQFYADLGYYPPLVLEPSAPSEELRIPELEDGEGFSGAVADAYRDARYHSIYTPTTYLIGMGEVDGDAGSDPNTSDMDDGQAGPGFRNPGRSRAWKDAMGPAGRHAAIASGRVFGPYVDVGSLGDLLQQDPETERWFIEDRWGNPIRYYRNWPSVPDGDDLNDPGAYQDVIARIPVEIRDPRSVQKQLASGEIDVSLDRDILGASYCFVSAGPGDGEFLPDGERQVPFGDAVLNTSAEVVVPQASGQPFNGAGLQGREIVLFRRYIDSNIRVLP